VVMTRQPRFIGFSNRYFPSPSVGEVRDIVPTSSSVSPYRCVCNTFIVYTSTPKLLERSVPIFVGALGTLGQHVALGSVAVLGVEISRVRKKLVQRPIRRASYMYIACNAPQHAVTAPAAA